MNVAFENGRCSRKSRDVARGPAVLENPGRFREPCAIVLLGHRDSRFEEWLTVEGTTTDNPRAPGQTLGEALVLEEHQSPPPPTVAETGLDREAITSGPDVCIIEVFD